MTLSHQYEFPLNEFIRNSLKIDRLLAFLSSDINSASETDLRNFISRLLELQGLLARPELKNELIKEVEKRQKKLSRLKDMDNIDRSALDATINKLESSISDLKNISTESYSHSLPYLIDAIKQREFAPGGQFDFDLPAYKCWLVSDPRRCYSEAVNIISEYTPITQTISMYLDLLRHSAIPRTHIAENGFFQLKDNHNGELLIIEMKSAMRIYPEISGGKHRVFIRFMELKDIYDKPLQTKNDVEFKLKTCFI